MKYESFNNIHGPGIPMFVWFIISAVAMFILFCVCAACRCCRSRNYRAPTWTIESSAVSVVNSQFNSGLAPPQGNNVYPIQYPLNPSYQVNSQYHTSIPMHHGNPIAYTGQNQPTAPYNNFENPNVNPQFNTGAPSYPGNPMYYPGQFQPNSLNQYPNMPVNPQSGIPHPSQAFSVLPNDNMKDLPPSYEDVTKQT